MKHLDWLTRAHRLAWEVTRPSVVAHAQTLPEIARHARVRREARAAVSPRPWIRSSEPGLGR